MKKTIKVKITFDESRNYKRFEVGQIIEKAISKKVKVNKFRFTYVETKYGIAEMPHDLMLAMCINGEYKFIFEN